MLHTHDSRHSLEYHREQNESGWGEENMKSRSDEVPFISGPPEGARDDSSTRYDEPFGWWGYHWTPPQPRSIVWLLEAGALDTRLAAFLSLAVELRRTVVVVAEPAEAGKTTLLTALLEFASRKPSRSTCAAGTSASVSWTRFRRSAPICFAMRSAPICQPTSGDRGYAASLKPA